MLRAIYPSRSSYTLAMQTRKKVYECLAVIFLVWLVFGLLSQIVCVTRDPSPMGLSHIAIRSFVRNELSAGRIPTKTQMTPLVPKFILKGHTWHYTAALVGSENDWRIIYSPIKPPLIKRLLLGFFEWEFFSRPAPNMDISLSDYYLKE